MQNAENPLREVKKTTTTVNAQKTQRQKYLIPALGCIKTNFINMSKWTTVSEEFFLGQEWGCTLRQSLIHITISGLGKP